MRVWSLRGSLGTKRVGFWLSDGRKGARGWGLVKSVLLDSELLGGGGDFGEVGAFR